MIDLRKKRQDLMDAQRRALDQVNFLNGAITLLNELIDDEEQTEKENAEKSEQTS